MTTLDLAREIAADLGLTDEESINLVYRRLLGHLVQLGLNYSVQDGERQAHRQFAQVNSLFWLPCVLCNQWFGGHEQVPNVPCYVHVRGIDRVKGTGFGVCPRCAQEAARVNELFPQGVLR